MPRPKGSKMVKCPKCGARVLALVGRENTCKQCKMAVAALPAPVENSD